MTETKTTTGKRPYRHYRHHLNHEERLHHQNYQQKFSPLIPLLTSTTTAVHNFLTQNDLQLLPSQTLSLESEITSTALSLNKLNYLLQSSLNPTKTLKPKPPPVFSTHSQCWFHRFLSLKNNAQQWVETFRMSKSSFDSLLEKLAPSLENSVLVIPMHYILGSALFRLAHGGSYKAVGRRFGMESEDACRAFYEVCKAVNDELSDLFELSTDLKRVVDGFGWISLPNCCGVLGFSQFLVEGNVGRVVVQGLVDSEGRFLDVSAGWPSEMSPTTILAQTKLFSRVEESEELFNGALFELQSGNLIPQYILGNSCYPLLPWLLTPYPISNMDEDCISNFSEQSFNTTHSKAMEFVSMAFARVRACWKLLSTKWKEECVEFLPFVILTGCLLHNFVIKCGDLVPDEIEVQSEDQEFPVFEGKGNVNGERIRDTLACHLCLLSEARMTYQLQEKSAFSLDHCYVILKDNPKWSNVFEARSSRPTKGKGRKNDGEDSTSNSPSVGGVELEGSQEIERPKEMERPLGSKKAKSKRNQEKSFGMLEGYFTRLEDTFAQDANETQKCLELRERELAYGQRIVMAREEKNRIQAEKNQVQLEKNRLQKMQYEAKILATDTSVLHPDTAFIIEQQQAEIRAEWGRARGGSSSN